MLKRRMINAVLIRTIDQDSPKIGNIYTFVYYQRSVTDIVLTLFCCRVYVLKVYEQYMQLREKYKSSLHIH